MVICLERGADCLHMVQLMPLHPKTASSLVSLKSRRILPFWYQLTQAVLEKRLLNGCTAGSSSSATLCTQREYKSTFNKSASILVGSQH